MTKPAALIVGNYFVSDQGGRAVCQDLSERLTGVGWSVTSTSWHRARARRLADMVTTSWRQRMRYDVACVDVFSDAAFFWAEAVCLTLRVAHKPFVLALRGGNLPAFAVKHPWRVRALLRSAAAVVAPSGYLRDAFRNDREDVLLQPNPLDIHKYPFRLRDRPSANIVWMRAFHSIYNPTLAVSVLAGLVRTYPNARLTMIGPDKGDGSLEATKRAAARAGVADRVSFTGAVAKGDVGHALADADLFLNTAAIDNAPVTVLEAMACGLPVVSTNVGGLPYLVRNGVDALLVPANDAPAMTRAVAQLLDTPGLAGALSAEARRAAAMCDWSNQLPRWERLLRSVIADKAAPAILAGRVPDA